MSPADPPPWVLVYGKRDGFSMVQHGGEGFTLATEATPLSRYTTLCAAYVAALRAGYEPTHWRAEDSSALLRLDQAAHWRSLMERGLL